MKSRFLPDATFRVRVRDDNVPGQNPYRWESRTVGDYFDNRRAIVFSLPGAFTPTCSTYQLPGYEKMHSKFAELGYERIYCISVNDAFVMNAWRQKQEITKIIMLPDGSGEFTRKMGMLVRKDNLGFGLRSWRYAAAVDNRVITHWFEEPGLRDNSDSDPYGVTSPENVLDTLLGEKVAA